MRKKLIAAAILLIFRFSAFAEEAVYLDNAMIQEYKGKLGLWVMVAAEPTLRFYLGKFQVSLDEVKKLNGKNFLFRQFIFFPYSDNYLKDLESKKISRECIASSDDTFIWPLSQVESISSAFGLRFGQFHDGADMPAMRGTPILASMDGRVFFVGYAGGHGRTIYIEHRNNFYSRYSHCSEIFFQKGCYVKKGQVIGLVGSSGNSTGNHLHFEIRYNDIPLNPLDFLPFKEHLKKEHLSRNWK